MLHMLVLFLTDAGLSLPLAGLYSSLVFAFSLVGKVAFGLALDRPDRRRFHRCLCRPLSSASD